jgi:hypothetical protein
MKKTGAHFTALLIAVLFVSSAAVAANTYETLKESVSKSSAESISDTLSLTSEQQSAAWQDIAKQARKENTPANFKATVGDILPDVLMTYPVPLTTSAKVPLLRRYQYAFLNDNTLLIINPRDRKVTDVITH